MLAKVSYQHNTDKKEHKVEDIFKNWIKKLFSVLLTVSRLRFVCAF